MASSVISFVHRRICGAILLMALAFASVFGAGTTYLCSVAGWDIESRVDHCETALDCQESSPDSGNRDEHRVVALKLDGLTPGKAVAAPDRIDQWIAEWICLSAFAPAAEPVVARGGADTVLLAAPPWSSRQGHSVSLLI